MNNILYIVAEVQEGGCDFSEELTLQELLAWASRHRLDLKFSPAEMEPGNYAGFGGGYIFCVVRDGCVA